LLVINICSNGFSKLKNLFYSSYILILIIYKFYPSFVFQKFFYISFNIQVICHNFYILIIKAIKNRNAVDKKTIINLQEDVLTEEKIKQYQENSMVEFSYITSLQEECEYHLALKYYKKGAPRIAAEYFKRIIAKDTHTYYPVVLLDLYKIYIDDQLLTSDIAKANIYLNKALQYKEYFINRAKEGNIYIQYKLGYLYEHGLVVEKNDEEAFELYQQAAEQGNDEAQYILGCLHENPGVHQNSETALEWYKRAAEQGHYEAMNVLENLGGTDLSIVEKEWRNFELYQQKAKQGNDEVPYKLWYSYNRNLRVEQSHEKFFLWYNKEVEQQNSKDKEILKDDVIEHKKPCAEENKI
jgi:TPR repeat protein